MTSVLLLRHAQSEWNAQGRWQGLADPPLSPLGEQQAVLAGPLLRPMGISALVSSDLRRARDTAERIAATLPLSGPIGMDPGLREYDLGAWSGLTRPEIEAGWPGEIEDWRQGRLFATPGGERQREFVDRISAAVARVGEQHQGQTVLAITHGGVMSALVRSLGSPAQRFTHLAGVWIDARPEGLQVGPHVSLLSPGPAPADQGEGIELSPSGVLDTRAR